MGTVSPETGINVTGNSTSMAYIRYMKLDLFIHLFFFIFFFLFFVFIFIFFFFFFYSLIFLSAWFQGSSGSEIRDAV